MKKTFIFGHKKPDTDSVMAAIGLAYLEKENGENVEARVLGNLNRETKYAINYFGLKEPKYLNDVKLQLRDVNYHKGFFLKETDSIYNGYQYMLNEELTGLPLVKEDNTFVGLITIKDLAREMLTEDSDRLETSYDNILDVLKGEEILRYDDEISGNIMAAAYKSTTFIEGISLKTDDILIVGDRHSIIEYAVMSPVKLLIVTGRGLIKEKHLKIARENHVNIIRTDFDTYHVARVISLINYIKTMIRSYNPIKFLDTDYVDDVIDINNKLRHTNYPIVNKENKCLGLLRITDLSDKNPKQVMLVDHNEPMQSADGLSEANILKIVDHHNLGSITTNSPVDIRSMTVGSTCTVLYSMYSENRIDIPQNIAGALLSGILSDTLILRSPTTTDLDRKVVENLSKLAKVDYEKYGMEMLKAGTSLEDMNHDDVLYNDFKLYTVNDHTIAIAQFFTMDFEKIKSEINEYVSLLDEVSEANNYDLLALYVTDIIKNGSYVLFNTRAKEKMEIMYNKDSFEEGEFIENCVSRKKNVVPLVMEIYEN